MLNGLLARKIGMTQIFEEDGTALPVTMLQSGPMTVVQKKTLEKEGCNHVQVGFEAIAERKVNKPIKGHFKTQTPTRFLRDFEVENIDEVDDLLKEVNTFENNTFVLTEIVEEGQKSNNNMSNKEMILKLRDIKSIMEIQNKILTDLINKLS